MRAAWCPDRARAILRKPVRSSAPSYHVDQRGMQPRGTVHRSESPAPRAVGHVAPKEDKKKKALQFAQRCGIDGRRETPRVDATLRRGRIRTLRMSRRIGMGTEA